MIEWNIYYIFLGFIFILIMLIMKEAEDFINKLQKIQILALNKNKLQKLKILELRLRSKK